MDGVVWWWCAGVDLHDRFTDACVRVCAVCEVQSAGREEDPGLGLASLGWVCCQALFWEVCNPLTDPTAKNACVRERGEEKVPGNRPEMTRWYVCVKGIDGCNHQHPRSQ